MLRAGILANTFETVFGQAAGGHVHFIEVAKRWADVDLTVFAPVEARETIARELPRAHFVTMPSSDFGTRSPQIRNLSRVVLGVLRRRELRACDVLLASSHFLPDVLPAFVAKGSRTVVCIHHLLRGPRERQGNDFANAISLVFQGIALAIVRRWGRVVVANHPEELTKLGLGLPRTHVLRMRHGVDHLRSTVPEQPTRFDAMYLGRLVPTKNPEDALTAWATATRAFPAARLAIAGAGDPAYVERLQRRAEALGIAKSVSFLGPVSNAERAALYAGARMFLFPSKEEGWGIVLAEAMSRGLPCVTYDLPAFRRDFVRGRTVVPLGRVDLFASAIVEILADDERRARLGAEASELAKTFRWDEAAAVELEALRLAAR
jgi:glycosyltransferase involved in cell wall biosynthesis